MPWKTFQEDITINAKYFSDNCTKLIRDDNKYNYCDDIYGGSEGKCCQDTVDFYFTNLKPNICYHLENNSSMILSCEFTSFNRNLYLKICLIISILILLGVLIFTNAKNKNPYFRNPEDIKNIPDEKRRLIVNSSDKQNYIQEV